MESPEMCLSPFPVLGDGDVTCPEELTIQEGRDTQRNSHITKPSGLGQRRKLCPKNQGQLHRGEVTA